MLKRYTESIPASRTACSSSVKVVKGAGKAENARALAARGTMRAAFGTNLFRAAIILFINESWFPMQVEANSHKFVTHLIPRLFLHKNKVNDKSKESSALDLLLSYDNQDVWSSNVIDRRIGIKRLGLLMFE